MLRCLLHILNTGYSVYITSSTGCKMLVSLVKNEVQSYLYWFFCFGCWNAFVRVVRTNNLLVGTGGKHAENLCVLNETHFSDRKLFLLGSKKVFSIRTISMNRQPFSSGALSRVICTHFIRGNFRVDNYTSQVVPFCRSAWIVL